MTNELTNLSAQIEGDFIAMVDEFHSLQEVWDNDLDAQIAKWYSNPPKVWPKRDHPYFSPSAATKCPRELYYRSLKAPRDASPKKPFHSRWQGIGTVIGDYWQKELLKIERNFEKHTGNAPRFRFIKNEDGTPMFEDFAKRNVLVEHNGEKFYLYGAPDGIMTYTSESGEIIRVGLEIKSKQQNPSKTSVKSLRQADYAHEMQTNLYAYMYGCDYYIVLYQNASKRGWFMTDEEYESFPDVRAFCRKITDADRKPLFDKFAEVTRALREGTPPSLDLDEWGFNEFKTHISRNLTDLELTNIQSRVEQAKRSSLPQWKINAYMRALDDIERLREAE